MTVVRDQWLGISGQGSVARNQRSVSAAR